VTGDVVVLFGDIHLAATRSTNVFLLGNVVATHNGDQWQDLVSVFGAVRWARN